jgi:uncharacterized protein (DUF2126 family)
VLADLAADGLVLDPAPFRAVWEWRFPPLLSWQGTGDGEGTQGIPRLELLPVPEPWPLICDFPREGGFTSRFVDASLRRFEVIANEPFRRSCALLLNGRALPLSRASGADPMQNGPLLAVRFRHHRLYPCLHPALEPHLPLTLVVRTPEGDLPFQLQEEGLRFAALSGEAAALALAEATREAPAWAGRRHAQDVTIDLRLEG